MAGFKQDCLPLWFYFVVFHILDMDFLLISQKCYADHGSSIDLDKEKETETLKHLNNLHSGKLVQHVVSIPDPCTDVAQTGDTLEVIYSGYFTDGRMFDSSHGKNPISFVLGQGKVIKGWEDGMTGMCQGEKRRLMVPPALAYGEAGYPPVIPANTPLLFEVTLSKLIKNNANLDLLSSLRSWLQILAVPGLISVAVFWLRARYKRETDDRRHERKEARNTRKKR